MIRSFDHHHIIRENNQIFVGTQNSFPELEPNEQQTSLTYQSDIFSYTVQEGDTLESISEKFQISQSLLQNLNKIYDDVLVGQEIKILANLDIPKKTAPIDVSLFDVVNKTDTKEGKLYIHNNNLVFGPKSFFSHSYLIDLNGYLESSVFPHPNSILDTNESRFILSIYFLKTPNDHQSATFEYFSGSKADLDKYQDYIFRIANLIQFNNNYQAPNPNSINYSQINSRSNSNLSEDNQSLSNSISTQTMYNFVGQIQFINGELDKHISPLVFSIRKQLPHRYQNSNWTQIFKNRIYGSSLNLLFRKVANKSPIILFITTSKQEVIGAFIPSGLKVSEDFYGSADTFVFRSKKEDPKLCALDHDESINFDLINHKHRPRVFIETFRSNKLASYRRFVQSTPDSILIGGDGSSAIFIKNGFDCGYSDECVTFNSPQLTSTRRFGIQIVDIWQIG